jgi:hypothetical protein
MSPLHGLRLNCLLAPLLAALLGVCAVLAGFVVHRSALAEAAAVADRAAICGLAELGAAAVPVTLAAWQVSHPQWKGVARVTVHGDELAILDQAGAVPLRREPTPELLLAYQGVQAWAQGGRQAVAAPCLPRQGTASVVVGWRDPPPAPPWWPWLGLAGGVLLLGGGLGAYLVARVYRPVEWMERATAAAAAGQAEPPGGADSPETASLRSSLATLISQRRHGDGADVTPTP